MFYAASLTLMTVQAILANSLLDLLLHPFGFKSKPVSVIGFWYSIAGNAGGTLGAILIFYHVVQIKSMLKANCIFTLISMILFQIQFMTDGPSDFALSLSLACFNAFSCVSMQIYGFQLTTELAPDVGRSILVGFIQSCANFIGFCELLLCQHLQVTRPKQSVWIALAILYVQLILALYFIFQVKI